MYCKLLESDYNKMYCEVYVKEYQEHFKVFSKVIKGVEKTYLSLKVIKNLRILSEISCKQIHYFILTGEPVPNPLIT